MSARKLPPPRPARPGEDADRPLPGWFDLLLDILLPMLVAAVVIGGFWVAVVVARGLA